MNDDAIVALFDRCSNTGRWGDDDELGTLNHITDAKRLAAAGLVRHGRTVSIGKDLSTVADRLNTVPMVHRLLYDQETPVSALDSVDVAPHGFAITHLDAVAHIFWRGNAYNGRRAADVWRSTGGLTTGSVHAQRDGIITRGVLLDVAGVRGVPYLPPGDTVTPDDLTAAEERAGVRVETGDAIFVHVGVERREAEHGIEDPSLRAGLDAACLPWLFDREVAVYSGDCVERVPYPSEAVPLPLHQIGLVAMGLVLLDCPRLADLVATCTELETSAFLLTVAPLRIPGGTGSAVNPLCLF
ncbi:MAG: cyclase family protein [Streptosporangiales bacterium]|nr:cyclase family protein [Streptosporangiales bacterium]